MVWNEHSAAPAQIWWSIYVRCSNLLKLKQRNLQS